MSSLTITPQDHSSRNWGATNTNNLFCSWKKISLVSAGALAVIGAAGFKTGYLSTSVSLACAIASLSLVSAVAMDTSIKKVKKQHAEPLDPELLHFLVTQVSLGLRCVQNKEQAKHEQQFGVEGDCLNLDPSAREVWNKFYPEDQPNNKGYTDRDLFLLNPKLVSSEKQQLIWSKWEQGVSDFIRTQIQWKSDTGPTFLLVNYPDDARGLASPYDLDDYGQGLGKRGKQWIPGNNILSIISPPDLVLTEEERMNYYRSSLIQAIRQAKTDLSSVVF